MNDANESRLSFDGQNANYCHKEIYALQTPKRLNIETSCLLGLRVIHCLHKFCSNRLCDISKVLVNVPKVLLANDPRTGLHW